MTKKMALLSQCPNYQFMPQLRADLDQFLRRNYAVEASVVSISFTGQQKYNVVMLRGKLPIKLQVKTRPIGFKFLLPAQYPVVPPYVYLDEPENPTVVELLDYVEKNNRIKNDFITKWAQRNNDPSWKSRLNLNQLLYEVFQLFTKAPPLSFEEIFGQEPRENPQAVAQPQQQQPMQQQPLHQQSAQNHIQAQPYGQYGMPAAQQQQPHQHHAQPQANSAASAGAGWGMHHVAPGQDLQGNQPQQPQPDAEPNSAWGQSWQLPAAQANRDAEDPLNEMLKFAEQEHSNNDSSMDLARQSSLYVAQKKVISIQEEEEEKKELIEEQKTNITEQLDQMFTLQKFTVTKTQVEQEFFRDNEKKLKSEHHKIEQARKREEEASEKLEEQIPRLEATLESMEATSEMTAETVVTQIIQEGPMGEVGRKIIKYQAKERAIQDAILALRDQSRLNVDDTIKVIRNLSKTQFRNQWKAARLIRYIQSGSV